MRYAREHIIHDTSFMIDRTPLFTLNRDDAESCTIISKEEAIILPCYKDITDLDPSLKHLFNPYIRICARNEDSSSKTPIILYHFHSEESRDSYTLIVKDSSYLVVVKAKVYDYSESERIKVYNNKELIFDDNEDELSNILEYKNIDNLADYLKGEDIELNLNKVKLYHKSDTN